MLSITRHYQACQFAKPKLREYELRASILKDRQKGLLLSSSSRLAINLDRFVLPPTVCVPCALPIVNSAHTKRGSTEREKERRTLLLPLPLLVPLVRSEHDDIRTVPEKTSLSTWKPARTNEGASERTNDSESDIIFDEAHDPPLVEKGRRRSPFSGPRARYGSSWRHRLGALREPALS